jgi:hypothetical protein
MNDALRTAYSDHDDQRPSDTSIAVVFRLRCETQYIEPISRAHPVDKNDDHDYRQFAVEHRGGESINDGASGGAGGEAIGDGASWGESMEDEVSGGE